MLSAAKKRVVLGAGIFVVLVLFAVPYININRYRESVANSISNAVGHKVTIREISLQTFPQPGLLLKGVVVDDDPSISAEPMLRDDDDNGVLATLRFTSLWRGRLEISSLKLSYPSINLVRGADGRWNIESLLERARQAPAAPTSTKRPETRIRFPYIEATGGRINLKIGQEKKVFALGEADFALWLASEDEWRMRLKARPIRTDASLTDTGTLKAEGSWKRAAQLRDTPLTFRLWWDYGQLGQLTTLIYGHDRGWRGTVRANALVEGSPENLKIISTARIEDFRRYDIAGGDAITLQAKCDAQYSLGQKQVHDLYCESPAGDGTVTVTGSFGLTKDVRAPNLQISADKVSAQFLATLAQHARTNVPEDIAASGTVNAQLKVHGEADHPTLWSGTAETSEIVFRSTVLNSPFALDPTKWVLAGPGVEEAPPKAKVKKPHQKEVLPLLYRLSFVSEPVALQLGTGNSAIANITLDRDKYTLAANGTVDLNRAIEVGRLLGLPTTSAELSGIAKGNLRVSGDWAGTSRVAYSGEGQIEKVTARISGVATPLNLSTARYRIDDQAFSLTKANATLEGVHSKLELSAVWPRGCSSETSAEPADCDLHFTVNADQLNVDEINALLNPTAQKRPWYAALTSPFSGTKRKFPAIHASGNVSATKLVVKTVVASHASADVAIRPKGFSITNLRADLLGGSYAGDITGDFASETPAYKATGNVVDISIGNIAAMMHDGWASGNLTGTFNYSGKGWSADAIASSAIGSGKFDWRDGTLEHLDLDGRGRPLQFKEFKGTVELAKGVLSFAPSKLQAGKSIYLVSGTATLGRDLQLKFVRDGEPGFSVSGPLERPKIVQEKAPQTQVSLKERSK